jgi:hypothetical protein
MRTRVSITGTTSATDFVLRQLVDQRQRDPPALSCGAITASGSPCTLFMACEKSASAASLIRWMA